MLSYDASSETQRAALAAVRAYLCDLPVELVAEASEPERELADRLEESGELAKARGAVGTFAIEPGSDGSTLVFFTEAGGEATLIRRFPPSGQSTRVAAEQAAIVVRSLVTALLEGGRIGVARPTTPDAAKRAENPATPPSAAAHRSFFASVGYVGTLPGGGLPVQSGASVGVRWFAASTLYTGARYTIHPSAELDAGSARISITRQPIELLLGYQMRASPGLNGELALIWEHVRRRTLETAGGFEPTPATSQWNFGLGPRLGVTLAPWPALRITLRSGTDFLLKRAEYSTDEQVLSEPAPVRPRLELEAGLALW